jgi:hypothetical protein
MNTIYYIYTYSILEPDKIKSTILQFESYDDFNDNLISEISWVDINVFIKDLIVFLQNEFNGEIYYVACYKVLFNVYLRNLIYDNQIYLLFPWTRNLLTFLYSEISSNVEGLTQINLNDLERMIRQIQWIPE